MTQISPQQKLDTNSKQILNKVCRPPPLHRRSRVEGRRSSPRPRPRPSSAPAPAPQQSTVDSRRSTVDRRAPCPGLGLGSAPRRSTVDRRPPGLDPGFCPGPRPSTVDGRRSTVNCFSYDRLMCPKMTQKSKMT